MYKIMMDAVSDDAAIVHVASLASAIWHEHFTPIIGKAQVEYMLDKFQSRQAITKQITEGYLYYLARDASGNAVGYLAVVPKEKELFLSKIYLTRDNRGKGYGRQMIEFAAEWAHDRGFHRITLTVNKGNTNSLKAYQKMGFAINNSIVTDIGSGFVMDDYVMGKNV
jgi:GNAT superfamily N-acetyltransferase